jgi:lantibiotic modifying enzyme
MTPLALTLLMTAANAPDRIYFEAAQKAAIWIRAETGRMKADQTSDSSLYSGRAGALVFFCELAHADLKVDTLRQVDAQAKALAQAAAKVEDPGLYTGLCGIAFALDCASQATGKEEYKTSAKGCLDRVVTAMKSNGEWNDTTDIVSGSAGIGCTLLRAANAWNRPGLLETAKKVGDRLIELARPQSKGLSWSMDPKFTRKMPNFSHGTAGVAYFLAQLGRATKEAKYMEAAKQGAAYLVSVSGQDGLIYHDEQDGKGLFYLGWCHGPVGTARLFAVLHVATKETSYAEWIDRAAATLLASGLPVKRTPGYWNNYGYCCGAAGMARFFLDLYRLDEKPEQIAFARQEADVLISRAESAEGGFKWTFAENRVNPQDVKAQTGLMQGAAGIGLALLWLDGFDQKRDALVRMPDAPWRW